MAHSGFRRDRDATNTEAIEDYAKAIYDLGRRAEGPVGTSALAERLGVSPGTVTAMIKRLAEQGLAEHEPYRGVSLTKSGERVALEVIRHHRLIEAYLSEALGMPWDRVHDEAEVLEHYISEELEELMSAALGHPGFDPHGDPIPNRQLELDDEATAEPLADLEPGERGVLTRVSDSEPEILRYLDERDIRPGVELEVTEKGPLGDPLTVVCDGRSHVVAGELPRRMLMRRVAGAGSPG